ncbi:hypothetical protein BTUL_0141g00170 [Botrytis tulipae]|uniref:Uncharacterized protein n=1 Tax=Botrytis tulipae TaxID=87230 RepID=A0A4Z1EHE6_9HELO|nr:hypothetical protein BTUL_0141g00170 [Botrytis tulipae]
MVTKDSTIHHCPKKSKGNCRRAYTPGPNSRPYCSTHMTYCKEEGCRLPYLLGNQRCERCAATAEKEELLAKEISKKEAKDKENAGSNKNGKDKDNTSKPKNVNQRLKALSSSHCAT